MVVRDPVIAILVLAGIFDWLSGNAVHSLLLLSAGGALVIDAVMGGPERRTVDPARTERAAGQGVAQLEAARSWSPVVAAVALVYAVVVGGFGRYSWPATLAVLVPASAAVAVAWRGPLREGPEPGPIDPAGVAVWVSLFVGLALWELTSLLLQPSLTTDSYAHPTISVAMDPALAHHPGRTIILFLWLLAGWFLVQR